MNAQISNDANTTITQLRSIVSDFVDARQWRQFHRPKNLAMSIAIEAAELMEHFQWLTDDQVNEAVSDEDRLSGIRDEMSDVLSYLLALANALDIDLSESLREKMDKNNRKYPANQFRGRYGLGDDRHRDHGA